MSTEAPEPTTWAMFGGRTTGPDGNGGSIEVFRGVGSDPRHTRFNGYEPEPVRVTENPVGPYWGWLRADDAFPVMIHERRVLFAICFPSGPEAAEAAGQGRIVRLDIVEDPSGRGADLMTPHTSTS